MPTLAEIKARFKKLQKIDLAAITLNVGKEVSITFARKQLKTAGRFGGRPWAGYGGEPKYAAYKMAVVGHLKPLVWKGRAGYLEDALTRSTSPRRKWVKVKGHPTLDINLRYIDDLERGGRGPFGERFPGRVIFPAGRALAGMSRVAAKKQMLNAVKRAAFKVTRK